jgi:hypothetical protein
MLQISQNHSSRGGLTAFAELIYGHAAMALATLWHLKGNPARVSESLKVFD